MYLTECFLSKPFSEISHPTLNFPQSAIWTIKKLLRNHTSTNMQPKSTPVSSCTGAWNLIQAEPAGPVAVWVCVRGHTHEALCLAFKFAPRSLRRETCSHHASDNSLEICWQRKLKYWSHQWEALRLCVCVWRGLSSLQQTHQAVLLTALSERYHEILYEVNNIFNRGADVQTEDIGKYNRHRLVYRARA